MIAAVNPRVARGIALVAVTIALGALASEPASASPTSARAANASAPAEPQWVYDMIDDFNLGISIPSAMLESSYTNYGECAKGPSNWTYVQENSMVMETEVRTEFTEYGKYIPGWVAQIAKLKQTPITIMARKKLVAAEALHAVELAAWQAAVAAVKDKQCGNLLASLKKAQQAGAPDWADQYAAVNAIAKLYGSNSASDQTPYAQKLG
jgi:hypothetical protein